MYLQSLILYPVVDMSHTTKINFNSLTGSFYLCIFSHSIPRGWYVPYNKNRFQFFDWIFLFMYLQSLILYPVVDMSHTTFQFFDWIFLFMYLQFYTPWLICPIQQFQFFDWIFLFMYLQSLILYPVVDMSHTTKIDFNSLTGSFYLCIFSH